MSGAQNQAMMSQKAIKNASARCEIIWDALSIFELKTLFKRIKRSNILQSPSYARAIARLNHQRIRCGVIRIKGEDAGLVTILEAGIFKNAVHGIWLDRGPLWFNGYGSMSDFESFLDAFEAEFPKRFGRRVRFIPEIENSAAARTVMEDRGYKSAGNSYQTIWLDLRPSEEDLRAGLDKKWRNILSKGEKNNLEIVWDGKHFSWLVQQYSADKALRGYDGPSLKTLKALALEFSRGQNMMIGTALLEGKPIAAILLLIHGASATYQIGYTSDLGREKCAHHVLLWNAVTALKERKIDDFDLGGVNEEQAKGVLQFKKGMGGELVETAGLFY